MTEISHIIEVDKENKEVKIMLNLSTTYTYTQHNMDKLYNKIFDHMQLAIREAKAEYAWLG